MKQIYLIGTIAIYSTLLMFSFAQQTADQNQSTQSRITVNLTQLVVFQQSLVVMASQANDTLFKANASQMAAQMCFDNAEQAYQQVILQQVQFYVAYFLEQKQDYENPFYPNVYNHSLNASQLILASCDTAMATLDQANVTVTNLTQAESDSLYVLANSSFTDARELRDYFQISIMNATLSLQQAQNLFYADPMNSQSIFFLEIMTKTYIALQEVYTKTEFLFQQTITSSNSAYYLTQNMTMDNAMVVLNYAQNVTNQTMMVMDLISNYTMDRGQQNSTIALDSLYVYKNASAELKVAQDAANSALLSYTYAAQTAVDAAQLSANQNVTETAYDAYEEQVKAAKARAAKARCDFSQLRVTNATRLMTHACQGQVVKK